MSKISALTCVSPGPQTLRVSCVALNILLTSGGYYALAIVGTVLSVPPSGFAVVWPATAFLVSILILTPVRHWWLYLLGVVPAHFHMVYHFQNADLALVVILSQLTGNFSLATITSLVVRATIRPRVRFDNSQNLLTFILLAGIAVPAVVNALILCLHLWSGWAADFWLSWRQWMLASVFPTITIPPLVITATRGNLVGRGANRRSSYVELGLLTGTLLIVCVLAFGWSHPPPEYIPVLLLAPLPLLLWAAIRLGVGATSLSLLVFAGAISASALAGRGPYALSSPIEDVLWLQVFLITVSIPLMLLAAIVEERTQAAASLRLSEQRLLTLQQEGQQRIAQELHDSTSQHLTAMSLNLMALRSKVGAEAIETIDDIRASLKEASRELRSFGYLLHPVEIQRDGLYATLQRYVDGFAMRTQLGATVRAPGAIDELPLPIQEALLRMVQESLANVYRHASGSRVTIKLSRVDRHLHLIIADDGKGIPSSRHADESQPPSLGVGIPGMRARARQFGGRLDIRSRARGTIVHAVMPIPRWSPPP